MAAQKPSGLGPEFTYDLSPLRKVDAALIHYAEAARVETGMENPRGIALAPGGRIVVAGDKTVRTFDADGKPRSEFATEAEPHAVAADAAGAVYVAMKDHVEVFDAAGKRRAAWGSAGPKSYLTGIAVGESDVFAADAGGRIVLRYDVAGQLVRRIGEKDDATQAPGFIIPSPYFDVALGREGMLWVANPGMRRVECYTYEGDFRFAWGKASMKIEGFCGCCNPTHFTILADGRFVTSEKGLPRVKVYGPEGEFQDVVAAPADFAEGTVGLDLAADAEGRILVLDPHRRQVRIFVHKKAEPKP